MRRGAGLVLGFAILVAAAAAVAQPTPEEKARPIRVGNLNVLVVGAGYAAHDHPTYDDHFFLGINYQRRILRREIRAVPIWVRGALQFTEDEQNLSSSYTYWPDPVAGNTAGPEEVEEQTSDFGIRAELLADFVHGKNVALYGGGGFVVHLVNFSSRGRSSGRQGAAGIEADENKLAPSVAAGLRLFSAKHPYTFYGEVRYGFTYGRATGAQDETPPRAPAIADFAVDSTSNVSFEGGIGVHW